MSENKVGDPKCFKDNFWNIERVRRNLKLRDIAEHFDRDERTVGNWFCGKQVPPNNIMEEMCIWFNDLNHEYPINVTLGRQMFEAIHLEWVALNERGIKMRGEDQDNVTITHRKRGGCGRVPRSRIAKLIKSKGFAQLDICNEFGGSSKRYLEGRTKASEEFIIGLSEKLDSDPELIEEMLTEVYNNKHNNPKQITTDDIIEAKSENPIEEPFVVCDPDGSVFDYASKPYYEYPSKEESDSTYSGGERFTKWFNLFNTILEDRKDIVAHLMYLYTQWDYNMYATIEALVYERNDIPFWVLRSIIIESEKVKYYGERNVTE